MTLWIVGRVLSSWDATEVAGGWDFQGVFDSEQKAVEACRDATYFVAPAELNVALPHDTEAFPGCYSPLENKEQ